MFRTRKIHEARENQSMTPTSVGGLDGERFAPGA